jgi:hypothetical protein
MGVGENCRQATEISIDERSARMMAIYFEISKSSAIVRRDRTYVGGVVGRKPPQWWQTSHGLT